MSDEGDSSPINPEKSKFSSGIDETVARRGNEKLQVKNKKTTYSSAAMIALQDDFYGIQICISWFRRFACNLNNSIAERFGSNHRIIEFFVLASQASQSLF